MKYNCPYCDFTTQNEGSYHLRVEDMEKIFKHEKTHKENGI